MTTVNSRRVSPQWRFGAPTPVELLPRQQQWVSKVRGLTPFRFGCVIRRMTVLCGAGCTGAHAGLVALGDRLKAPMIAMINAMRGKEPIERDTPDGFG